MNQKGFSYIETLIAAAILSIIIIPVLAGFHIATLNQRYAETRYLAATQAELALNGAARFVRANGFPEIGMSVVDFLDTEFLMHDQFNFVVSVSDGYQNRTVGGTTSGNLVSIDFPDVNIPSIDDWDWGSLIYIHASGSTLILDGKPAGPASGIYIITVDVYDAQNNLLIRMGQIA